MSNCCTKLRQVTVKIGEKNILDHIDLDIRCQEILGIIGPNGAGKTTLMRALLGEIPFGGHIDYVKHKTTKARIGYVPQYLSFDAETPLTVLELFAICLRRRPIWLPIGASFKEKVLRALEEVHLTYVMNQKIGELSGGELQRVLLALALMPVPDLLLLDEPISGVDTSGKTLFYETVQKLKEKHHMAIVLISHDLEQLDSVCDRVVLLNGQILAEGSVESITPTIREVMGWQ